jgi:NlpC/P60 family putative phage cell wall peptidase
MIVPEKIVAIARSWRGTPYHHQASLKGVGCDCLGLIRGVWREVVGEEPEAMPAYTKDWNETTGAEALLAAAERHLVSRPRRDMLQGGDVVVFRLRRDGPAKRAGVMVSSARMVHTQEGAGVVEVEVSSWWRRRIAAAFSFPGAA